MSLSRHAKCAGTRAEFVFMFFETLFYTPKQNVSYLTEYVFLLQSGMKGGDRPP